MSRCVSERHSSALLFLAPFLAGQCRWGGYRWRGRRGEVNLACVQLALLHQQLLLCDVNRFRRLGNLQLQRRQLRTLLVQLRRRLLDVRRFLGKRPQKKS